MDPNRQHWALQQQEVRRLLAHKLYADALRLWLRQHAMLHSAVMAQEGGWSLHDEVVEGLTEAHLRWQPSAGANSIAWLLWHMTRIEDVTMNLLVAGQPQVVDEPQWLGRLGLSRPDVGTAMGDSEVAEVSARLDLAALQDYRVAVGRRTRMTISTLQPRELDTRVAPERIRALRASGAIDGNAGDCSVLLAVPRSRKARRDDDHAPAAFGAGACRARRHRKYGINSLAWLKG